MAGQEVDKASEYQTLIQHLRGFRDIVINTSHGGFGLSRDAQLAYLERSQTSYTLIPREDRYSNDKYGPTIIVNGQHWYDNMIPRDDPVLVNLVNELGKNSWGDHARLKVVRIPADVDWQIDEYDGLEWVAEKHQTWR